MRKGTARGNRGKRKKGEEGLYASEWVRSMKEGMRGALTFGTQCKYISPSTTAAFTVTKTQRMERSRNRTETGSSWKDDRRFKIHSARV